MATPQSVRLAQLLVAVVVASCAIAPETQAPEGLRAADARLDRVLAAEGLKLLDQRRYEDASRVFSAGLKYAPSNASLHFLNGLSYHMQYLGGNEGLFGLAATGYELALRNDPAQYRAALQLGRLEFQARRYAEAAKAFQHATRIDARSGEAYAGLASAAYYAHDVAGGMAAAERAVSLLPGDAEAFRALAMTRAAAGETERARQASLHFAALETDPRVRARVDARLDQWNAWHEAGASSPARPPGDLAQSPLPKPPDEPERRGEREAGARPPAPGSARKAWFECDSAGTGTGTSLFASGAPATSSSFFSSDDSDVLQAPVLPSPCEGAGNPRMVVLDVVFIRTDDTASTSHGINLLESLNVAFVAKKEIIDTILPDGTRDVTTTRNRSRSFGAVGSDGFLSLVNYTLNIANATDNRTEVLAKPTLVALDRMPSTFFSGRNVTLGVSGEAGGSSLVTDRPVGVSLSVTPTFIDDDTIALSVRAQRSFIEELNLNVNFNQSLQTTRNAVVANVVMKLGETLILSGLSEQERQRSMSGVPVLMDIPVLQYLASQNTTQNFTTSVLVLVTPRAPVPDRELLSRTLAHVDTLPDAEKRKYRSGIERALKASDGGAPDNLDATYRHAYGNSLYLQFRSGDLSLQHWSQPSRLDGFFRELRELLYF